MTQPIAVNRVYEITNWKSYHKNTLRGFFSVTLPNGLIINHLMLHENGDRRWIGFPAKEWNNDKGDTHFSPIINFTSTDIGKKFEKRVIDAIDHHFSEVSRANERQNQRP